MIAFFLFLNPFQIDFPPQKELDFTDYEIVQEKLHKIDVKQAIQERYPKDFRVIFDDFDARLHRGLRQTLINAPLGLFPEKEVVALNGGGEGCIVLFASLDRIYPGYVQSLIEALKEVGYQGYVYYRLGGYPNPTGEEIAFAGVPYAFKLFMLEEAKNLGFRYLLWLDASLIPLKNPAPLFEIIKRQGVVYKETAPLPKFMLPKTREEIQSETGIDPLSCRHLRMPVFGVDVTVPWFDTFLKEHKRLVRKGTPFISCLPEEYVLTALKERLFKHQPATDWLVGFDLIPSIKNGYYFYLRPHG